MTDSASKEPYHEDPPARQAEYTDSITHRKVSVKGSGGVTATVIVTTQRGQVWLSIVPPFTWEAFMEPGKVDELIHTLGLAGEEARRMAVARSRRASGADEAVVRKITGNSAHQ